MPKRGPAAVLRAKCTQLPRLGVTLRRVRTFPGEGLRRRETARPARTTVTRVQHVIMKSNKGHFTLWPTKSTGRAQIGQESKEMGSFRGADPLPTSEYFNFFPWSRDWHPGI